MAKQGRSERVYPHLSWCEVVGTKKSSIDSERVISQVELTLASLIPQPPSLHDSSFCTDFHQHF